VKRDSIIRLKRCLRDSSRRFLGRWVTRRGRLMRLWLLAILNITSLFLLRSLSRTGMNWMIFRLT
jgi:hypothetical protein